MSILSTAAQDLVHVGLSDLSYFERATVFPPYCPVSTGTDSARKTDIFPKFPHNSRHTIN